MWFHMARIVREVRPRFIFVENSPMLTSRGLGRVLGDLAAMGYDAEWGVLGAVDVGAPHRRDRIWIVGALADALPSREWRESRESEDEATFASDSPRFDRDSRRAKPARQLGVPWVTDGGDEVADAIKRRGERGRECGVCIGGDEWREESKRCNPIFETTGCSPCVSDSGGERLQEQHAPAKPDQSGQHSRGIDSGWTTPWWATEPAVGRVAHGVADRVDRLKAIGNGQVSLVAAAAFRILTERAGWTA